MSESRSTVRHNLSRQTATKRKGPLARFTDPRVRGNPGVVGALCLASALACSGTTTNTPAGAGGSSMDKSGGSSATSGGVTGTGGVSSTGRAIPGEGGSSV